MWLDCKMWQLVFLSFQPCKQTVSLYQVVIISETDNFLGSKERSAFLVFCYLQAGFSVVFLILFYWLNLHCCTLKCLHLKNLWCFKGFLFWLFFFFSGDVLCWQKRERLIKDNFAFLSADYYSRKENHLEFSLTEKPSWNGKQSIPALSISYLNGWLFFSSICLNKMHRVTWKH